MQKSKTVMITGGPLKPHEYVEVLRTVTAGVEEEVQNQSIKIGGTKKNPKVEMAAGSARIALLREMIVSWQLTDTVEGPDGTEKEIFIPFSLQAIRELPRATMRYLEKKINELNPDDEESDEAFTSAASGHSEGS